MRTSILLGALLMAGALTPIQTATAAVDDCTSSLTNNSEIDLADSTALWDLNSDGSVNDGMLLASGRSDAYDDFAVFAIDDGTNGLEDYTNPGSTCTYELDGRQVAFPSETTLGGLEISRKVYVPASGPSYARFYNQVHNPLASPMTITLYTNDGT